MSDERQVLTHSRRAPERAVSVLSYLILLGGIATIGIALYMVLVCYSSLPWSDGWTQVFVAARGENPFSLRWLWQQHNEHRLPIPKLFLALDLRLFGARQELLLAAIFTIQLLHLWLLSWSMRALGGWRGPLWRTGVGLAAFCMFCPTQWENLIWGFQTCFVLPGLFATLSFAGLLLYWMRSRQARVSGPRKFIFLSAAAAVAATWSLANGNLLAPILIAGALLLRLRYSVMVTYLVTAVLSTTLYFHGYIRPTETSDPASSIRSPIKLIEYVGTYFGSSWGYGESWTHHNLQVALYAGLTGLAIAALFLARFRRMAEASRAFSVQLLLLLLFCIGTAFLTALGRVNFGNGQAFAPRYQTVALLFWCCLGCLLLAVSNGMSKRLPLLAVQMLLVGVLLRGAVLMRFPLREAREHAFQQRAAAAALITGVDDREQIEHAFPHPDYVLSVVPYMRDKRLSIFGESHRPILGASVESVVQLAGQDQCRGTVQAVSSVQDGGEQGLHITGWAWDLKGSRPPSYIVVVADGRMAGVGAMGDWSPIIRAANPYMNTSFVGFTAYAKNVPPASPVSLYAVLHATPEQACYVATIQPSR